MSNNMCKHHKKLEWNSSPIRGNWSTGFLDYITRILRVQDS